MKKQSGSVVYSPSDLVRFFGSPFASWMERYLLENPGAVVPDQDTEDRKLVAQTGMQHEDSVLQELKLATPGLVEIHKSSFASAQAETLSAISAKAPVIFQAALQAGAFAGYADFLILDSAGNYQVWDTKLAQSPKPNYAIQLCCYSEMLAAVAGQSMPEKFGIILGNNKRPEFRVEEFIYFYLRLKDAFLTMQGGFTGILADRPEPLPRADHGHWSSQAEAFFAEADHLVQIAGISVGQIKKLKGAGITTAAALASASGVSVPKLAEDSMSRLVAQARLQIRTREDRKSNPEAGPRFEVLAHSGPNGEPLGLASLPPAHPEDVFFDMEGYPLIPGGLEYLFGAVAREATGDPLNFNDWWAHDREEEKLAFEGFVDWVFARWKASPGMHIYHYAPYETGAVRRLSTRHNTRVDEVDDLLRNNVFVDLYQIVRHSLRIGEDSYSIKKIERLYRPKRVTEVATAADSIVQYAGWVASGQSRVWKNSGILKGIRDYNEDDCRSTAELSDWLRGLAKERGIASRAAFSSDLAPQVLPPDAVARQNTEAALRERHDPAAVVLADLIEFHRREAKPIWWRMFDRANAAPEELRDDPGCIEGVHAQGTPALEKRSLVQRYAFDPSQECKLAEGEESHVMFAHNLEMRLNLSALDLSRGELAVKVGQKSLSDKSGGAFPAQGALLPVEFVSPGGIPSALTEVAAGHLSKKLHSPVAALLARVSPATPLQPAGESSIDAAIRIVASMSGGCLVIQGPPGTGKTHTASRVINALLAAGKRVGVASNSHKAVLNLFAACGDAARESGQSFRGIKVRGEATGQVFSDNPGLLHIKESGDAFAAYTGGAIGGTAWLFARPEWKDALDFLFIDEAGQVPLANAVAMARSARNLVLLGDQMQLEQPVQGAHPGDAGLSVLQYALKDPDASETDAPVFHAVVPPDLGLFLGESRRMHPDVCRFISDSIYEGRLNSHPDCTHQRIALPANGGTLVPKESGIVFSGIEHDGSIQQSDEEVVRVQAVFHEMLGRAYTDKNGKTENLALEDFLFIAPYNAQVRALQAVLPDGARVGSVDKFQGQEAPVCILSLCSSFGEYGSRGLGFILDRNRINVAVSRAKCLAVIVADPRIAHSAAGSIGEMNLLNLFCKLCSA